jgi:16S rRNA (cytidine1402-2'-O)-methyltransferase
MSTLYIVSTPIGNLSDLTFRAVDVLSQVDRVLAEDTRRTAILCRRHEIRTPLISAHAHNEAERAVRILEWLDAGESIAIVSDAGTPLLSDPGARIVRSVLDAGHGVIPVPGASAILAGLVASGIEPEPFTFFGFTPRTGRERGERLSELAAWKHTAVLFESPRRLHRLLRDLEKACGPDRRVSVGREITKVHETFFRGTLAEAAAYYGEEGVRGEVVVIVAGAAEPSEPDAANAIEEWTALARSLLREGRTPSRVARELTRTHGVARNTAYQMVLSLTGEGEGETD